MKIDDIHCLIETLSLPFVDTYALTRTGFEHGLLESFYSMPLNLVCLKETILVSRIIP